jgi:hypothetical protein
MLVRCSPARLTLSSILPRNCAILRIRTEEVLVVFYSAPEETLTTFTSHSIEVVACCEIFADHADLFVIVRVDLRLQHLVLMRG